MENNQFTQEYFREELTRFREFMGQKLFWEDLERSSLAVKGLAYVYLNTDRIEERDKNFFAATMEEYDRRLALILLYGLNKYNDN